MLMLMLALIILNLIFVYKNKMLPSKIVAAISLLSYTVYAIIDIVPLVILMKSAMLGYQAFLWDIIIIVLCVIVLLTVFKGLKKASLWLLWIIFALLILSNWNIWLTYIIALTSGI